jgi:hypothetical protein
MIAGRRAFPCWWGRLAIKCLAHGPARHGAGAPQKLFPSPQGCIMFAMISRFTVTMLVVAAFTAFMEPASGKDRAKAPDKITGYFMKYTAKGGSITQITVLEPTPKGKVLQKIHTLGVDRTTKFIVTVGGEKMELDAKTVLTDDATKGMLVQKDGSTLNNNEGIRVEVETKGKAATKVTFTQKLKK